MYNKQQSFNWRHLSNLTTAAGYPLSIKALRGYFILLLALMISQNAFAQKTWTGTTNTNWATSTNWSPSGVPGAGDVVTIPSVGNNPVVFSGTSAVSYRIIIQSSGILTVNSGGTLTVTPASTDYKGIDIQNSASVTNNGTINITFNLTQAFGYAATAFIFENSNASLNNSGTLNLSGGISPQNANLSGFYVASSSNTINNNSSGIINFPNTAIRGHRCVGSNMGNVFNNQGTINYGGTDFALDITTGNTFTNSGAINVTNGLGISVGSGILNNQACGKIVASSGNYDNQYSGNTTNAGLMHLSSALDTSGGTFTNTGVLKYGSISGTVTNSGNGSVTVNNTTPIFTYGGTFNGTVNGIYTNSTATTSAGTFTAPNTFTPSGLPTGSQTLYAKITPSGGACNYVLPFTYNNIGSPSVTTTGSLTAFSSCSGTVSASQSFTVSGTNLTANIGVTAPTGFHVSTSSGSGYASSISLPQSSGTVNTTTVYVRLESTATGSPSGNVDCYSTGATTRTLAVSGTVTNLPTLTVGTATNPTTCAGTTGSIAFSSTNLPNGTYSLSFTDRKSVV